MKLKQLISEAQDYGSMFNDLPWADMNEREREALKTQISRFINLAKVKLKKNDRIIWFLRLVKIACVTYFTPTSGDITGQHNEEVSVELAKHPKYKMFYQKIQAAWKMSDVDVYWQCNDFQAATRILNTLVHHLSLPIPQIQNTVFTWQEPTQLLNDFHDAEAEWKKKLSSMIPLDESDYEEILIDFHDGWVWMDLGRGSCSQEADAMGHCGNVPSERDGDTILSLRTIIDAGPAGKFAEPHLTFILDGNGYLGEMKGRGNDKPAQRYHKYIVALLQLPQIEGIKGGGYLPDHNFKLTDLEDDEQERLVKLKPSLRNPMEIFFTLKWDRENADKLTSILNAESQHSWGVYNHEHNEGFSLYPDEESGYIYYLDNLLGSYKFLKEINDSGRIDDDELEQILELCDQKDHHDWIVTCLNALYRNNPTAYDELANMFDTDGQLDLFGEKHVSPSKIIAVMQDDPDHNLAAIMNKIMGRDYLVGRIKNFFKALQDNYYPTYGYLIEVNRDYYIAFAQYDFEQMVGEDEETYEDTIGRIDWHVEHGEDRDATFRWSDRLENALDFPTPKLKADESNKWDTDEMSKQDFRKVLHWFIESLLSPEALGKAAIEAVGGEAKVPMK